MSEDGMEYIGEVEESPIDPSSFDRMRQSLGPKSKPPMQKPPKYEQPLTKEDARQKEFAEKMVENETEEILPEHEPQIERYTDTRGEGYLEEEPEQLPEKEDPIVGSSMRVEGDMGIPGTPDYNEEQEEDEANALLTEKASEISKTKLVESMIDAGYDTDEIVAQTKIPRRSVQTMTSNYKKKRGGSLKESGGLPSRPVKAVPIAKGGLPPEAIIETLELPDMANGNGKVFEQGMKFAMSAMVMAVRMMQELAGIGMQQVKPTIEMAKAMRAGEAEAAKAAAGDAAMEAAGLVAQHVAPAIDGIKKQIAGLQNTQPVSVNPMRDMMMNTMQPYLQNLMSGVMSNMPGMGQFGALPGGPPAPNALPAGSAKASAPAGWGRRSE